MFMASGGDTLSLGGLRCLLIQLQKCRSTRDPFYSRFRDLQKYQRAPKNISARADPPRDLSRGAQEVPKRPPRRRRINPSINQSINHSITQSINHATNQSIMQCINRSINQSFDRLISQITQPITLSIHPIDASTIIPGPAECA